MYVFNPLKHGDYNLCRVAARSKTWLVFARTNTEIVGTNPTRGMDVYVRLFCVYVAALRLFAPPPPRQRSPTVFV
jgi:hypothetical protein